MGALTVIIWKNTMGAIGLYEIVPGFILSFISIIIVSLLDKAPSQEVVERFEKSKQIYDHEIKNL